MKTLVLAVAGLAALSAPALAGDLRPGGEAPRAEAQRVVMECGTDAATRRAFAREHGAAPVFVTARDVQTARVRGEGWSAPRCMTAREHARLVQNLSDQARGR